MNFKNRFRRTFSFLFEVIFTMALVSLFLFEPPPLLAQVTATTTGTLNSALLAGATTYTINSAPQTVHKDRGLGVLYSLTPAAVTNAVTMNIQVANDTNTWAWSTPYAISLNLTSVGTNYIGFTNFDKATFNNVTYWRLATITAANTNALTNTISWSVHN